MVFTALICDNDFFWTRLILFTGITDTVQVIADDEDISVGDELVLRCKTNGNPEAQITWYRNGAQLFKNERVSFKENQLHLFNVTLQDNGIYSCKVINDAGSVSSNENFALKLTGMVYLIFVLLHKLINM